MRRNRPASRWVRKNRLHGLDTWGRGPAPETLEPRLLLAAAVLTYHNDNASTGQNLAETTLTPADVNPTQFGKLDSVPLDGTAYAQPLYVPSVAVSGQGTHNVVYVATEHDSLYAIDADTGAVLWKDSFIDPAAGVTTIPFDDPANGNFAEIGISGDPVIDPNTGTLYLVARTEEVVDGVSHYVQRLHAIDITSGAEKFGGPVVIADTSFDGTYYTYNSGPSVAGNGDGSSNGVVTFNAMRQNQRVALTEANGNIYVGWASVGDVGPYQGWILGFNAATLALDAVFNDAPNGTEAGIWESQGRIAVDDSGDLYFETGNGTFDTTLNAAGFPIDGDYGDSFVKLAPDSSTPADPNINGWGLKVVDYFTPSNQQSLNDVDDDLGSGGPLLLPDSAGDAAHPHLLIGAGKEGKIYLIDADNMGHFDPNADHVVQETGAGLIGDGSYGTPAYFNGTFYYGGFGDQVKAFSVSNAALSTAPTSQSPNFMDYGGTTPSVSADGTSNGIVWALDYNGTGVLYAYDASNLANELYDSTQAAGGRDQVGASAAFTVPTVVNGKVYVAGESLTIYGELSTPATATSLKQDATTQGTWMGTYGGQGYDVIDGSSSLPSYATVTPSGQSNYVWAASTGDPRALQTAGGSSRIAATWYSATSFTVDVNLTDGQKHDLELYFLDWDNLGRTEQVQISDAGSGAVLSTQTVSSFISGVYLDYAVSGNLMITISNLAGKNAVLSGLFLDPATTTASTATFLGQNATTEGTWTGIYGAQGYEVIGGSTSLPGSATITPSGQSSYTWAGSTTDARALQTSPGASSQVAATWYSATSFSVDVNLTDGQQHNLELYFLDWDDLGRSEQVQISDAGSGAVLSTQTVSSFQSGVYLDYAVRGNLVITITSLAGKNAVLSGLFLDQAS